MTRVLPEDVREITGSDGSLKDAIDAAERTYLIFPEKRPKEVTTRALNGSA